MDDSPSGTAVVDCDTLFAPPNLSVLLLNCSANKTGRIDRLLKVKIRDICTAYLVLYNKDTNEDELLFVLDLRSNIYKEKEEIDSNRNLCSVFYQVERDGNVIQFEVIPTSADGIRDVQAFDFILGQYAMKDDSLNKDGIICEGEDRNPNVVAQGFESTGMAVRVALRSSGLYTGHAIRYLGQQYTSIVSTALGISGEEGSRSVSHDHASSAEAGAGVLKDSSDSPGAATNSSSNSHTTRATVDATVEEIERANNRRKWAEGVHSAATSVTGAVLFPVRWTGRVAAELGGKGGSDRPNSENAVSKVFLDTVGGIGNGMMSVCKGVTEAIGEVGSAIGDSAMHHSATVNGSEYAETVTKCYVDAASELGLASYKVANVATLGWQGVLVNAALEGTTFLMSLYEYLMGPVLLQGYMEMMQMPMLKIERFFVVLRPWSIAFYRSAAEITGKPYKVVATSMLDTLPKLRIRAPGVAGASPSLDMLASTSVSSASEVRPGEPVSGQKLDRDEVAAADAPEQEEDFSYWHRSDYDAFDSGAPTPALKGVHGADKETDVEDVCCTGSAPAAGGVYSISTALDKTKQDFQSAMTQLAGGATSRIELCTVDCSTFILYPPSETIHQWFHELSAATGRVETIAKRKSGADEIALYRRLDMYPITSYVTVKVKRFVRTTPKPSMFDMFIRKRSALNTGTVDDLLNQELEQLRPESGASVGAAATDSSPVADAKSLSPSGTSEEEFHDAAPGEPESQQSQELKGLPVAQEVGNLSDDDDVYECDDFWIAENPDLLSGSYLEIVPEDHDRPDASAYPMLPSTSSDGSPSPVQPSFTSSEALEGCGVSNETASGATAGGSSNHKVSDPGSTDALRNPPLPLSTDVTNVSRAFFAPEVQCSIYPVTRNGTLLVNITFRSNILWLLCSCFALALVSTQAPYCW